MKEHPDSFDREVHNELRDRYAGIDERKSAEHTDVILKHSTFDGYMLSILSGWELGKNREQAEANLLHWTTAYPDLKFVRAACWLKVGDLYAEAKDATNAETYYQRVIGNSDPEVSEYRSLAVTRLKGLQAQ